MIFQREQGYFTGALYINLLTAELSVLLAFLVCLFVGVESPDTVVTILLCVGVLVPALFFHHSRSLWLCFDHFIDPIQDRAERHSDGTATW